MSAAPARPGAGHLLGAAGVVALCISAYLVEAGYVGADQLLPLVFGVIFATVLSHGATIGIAARRLGLTAETRDSVLIVGASPWSVALGSKLKDMDIVVLVADSS